MSIPSSPLPARIDRTYKWDLIRGGLHGTLEPIWQTFVLLIVIRFFQGSDTHKSLIASGPFIGLLLNPFVLHFLSARREKMGTLCALFSLLMALSLVGVAFTTNLTWFVVFAILGQVFLMQHIPFMATIYTTNYPVQERGRRVSSVGLMLGLVGAISSYIGGKLLDLNLEFYEFLFLGGAVAAAVMALSFYRMPTDPVNTVRAGKPWENTQLIWKDNLFGFTLLAWMLLGIGNLMLFPIRVEYMANPNYGIDASESEIAVMLIVLPLCFRLLSTKIWGFLFDRFSLIPVRVLLNVVFIASFLLFFLGRNFWVMAAGMMLFGVANGGGRIIWQLWVTRIAPQERVSGYMSIHSGLTGVRGIFSAFLGFYLLANTTPLTTCLLATGLLVVSIFLFIPMYRPMKEREIAVTGR